MDTAAHVWRSVGRIAIAIAFALAAMPAAAADIQQITVTAERVEENPIDVPIALSVFDDSELIRRQIDQTTDLQLHVPNVTFTKTNFNGSNFQIRGIGVSATGAGAESGVEAHFNSVPIRMPRLFETEYFDVERVEILRGPQGTLYGRNATGGIVNVLAKKPIRNDLSGGFEVETGNYREAKARGAFNLPLGDIVSMRLAGIAYRRDGFSRNLFTGHDIDGRDQWSVRGALRIQPSDRTDITLTGNYYEEDSTRLRSVSRMCHRDPTGAYGCLPDRLDFDAPNRRASLGGTLGELLPQVIPGAASVALIALGTDMNEGAVIPRDPRQMYAELDPVYRADETIATLEIVHDFGALTFTALGGYQDTSVFSRSDDNLFVTPGRYNGGGMTALFGGGVPLTRVDDGSARTANTGIVGTFTRPAGYDQPQQKAHQWSQEVRLASHDAGLLDFQVGALYLKAQDDESYSVAGTDWEYASRLLQLQPSYLSYAAPVASLESSALFGELYWMLSDKLKWTLGLRWTDDEKRIEDRQLLFSVPPSTPLPDFRERSARFRELTGRFGADWKPGWFDDSALYAFYSHGYKAGGFNPIAEGTPQVYEPEFVHAFEIGSKNVLANGRVLANLSAFYYRYDDLQMSKIVARTAINENVDADIHGLEAGLVFQPLSLLRLDMDFAYLKTRIRHFSSIDPRDVSNGNPAWTVVKDVSNAANYVIPTANLPAARAAGCILPAELGGPFGLVGLLPDCGPAFGVAEGIAVDLEGRQLPYSPEWSVRLGAQYIFDLGGMRLTPRIDYYWRDAFYTRIFNRPIDRVGSWDVVNATADLTPASGSWYVRTYIKNAFDKYDITGMHLSDASAGLFTNVFALEPRTYGVAIGVRP